MSRSQAYRAMSKSSSRGANTRENAPSRRRSRLSIASILRNTVMTSDRCTSKRRQKTSGSFRRSPASRSSPETSLSLSFSRKASRARCGRSCAGYRRTSVTTQERWQPHCFRVDRFNIPASGTCQNDETGLQPFHVTTFLLSVPQGTKRDLSNAGVSTQKEVH